MKAICKYVLKPLMNWRYYVLFVLFGIGSIGIFCVPSDDSETWFTDLFISKAVGGLFIYVFYKLTEYWNIKGLIPELMRFTSEEED